MRLAILAISAVAVSGCSWVGGGKHHKKSAAVDCVPAYGAQYGAQAYQAPAYGYAGGPVQCANGSYSVGHTGAHGYAHAGYDQAYAPHAQYQGYGAQGYGAMAQQPTTLSHAAPYGAAVGNPYGQNVVGTQYSDGQFVQGAGVQTVAGSPVYVPQPYGAPQLRGSDCCGPSVQGAMPFGVEVFGGTEFNVSGDFFTEKPSGPPDGDYTQNINVGEIAAISYDDAFDQAKVIGGSLAYDVSRNTTVLGTVSYSESEGQTVEGYTTVQDGTWSGTTFTPATGSTARALDGTFSDLKLTTVEAGIRQYVGNKHKFRPYVGATAGFTHNNEVEFTQTYSDDGTLYGQRQFADSGWNPTASAVLGAELAVGPRAAIGIESGVRWSDNFDTGSESDDRISVPLSLRGRLAF